VGFNTLLAVAISVTSHMTQTLLWPRVNNDHAYHFTYDELCHACWFSQFLLSNLPRELTPSGFSVGVRKFMFAYENSPNGECRIPAPPINFGM
jgi:hypothetical protein